MKKYNFNLIQNSNSNSVQKHTVLLCIYALLFLNEILGCERWSNFFLNYSKPASSELHCTDGILSQSENGCIFPHFH